jgi:hypothetical protein
MRNLFWILLLGNVILFALMQRGGLGWGEQELQVQPDLHGEMIHLMPAQQTKSPKELPPTKPVPASVPVSNTAPVPPRPSASSKLNLSMDMAKPAEVKPAEPVCLEWGEFSGPDLVRATATLSALQLGDSLSQRQIDREIGYWVYMPPLRNKAAVNRKIGELKALGINDYFVVQGSGRWQNAISLGVFKTRDAAQNFLHALNARGVRTARVGERLSKVKTTLFIFNGIDAATRAKLVAMQKDFPGSELNSASCGLTR